MTKKEITKFVFGLLGGLFGPLFDLIKAEIDGGADAQSLRDKEWELYVSFKGGEGEAVVEQRAIESEMHDPDAE